MGFENDLFGKYFCNVVCDLRSTVSIEHCKEMHSICHLLTDDCVFHASPPPLHFAGSECQTRTAAGFDVFGEDGLFEVVSHGTMSNINIENAL